MDLFLASLPGLSGGLLHAPIQGPQKLPDVSRMELLSGDPVNDRGYPRQSPQIRAEAMLPGALTQGRVHLPQLAGAEPWLATRPTRCSQPRHALGFPLPVPATDTLSAGLQLSRHRSLPLPFCKQASRLLAPMFQTLEITQVFLVSHHGPA